ncbi:spore coat associated protein CotJA [Alkaliphilus peptidifermentans]|uniref:Spore coat associated protein JA (CotJA) n=1 Tax=Alkaliphilus peptidifermentans DSM 18978 TaxID=1120976 RepID=A0A1G5KQ93_9FIRM|nr:spore coat associated protein CotJA [Alkaliphilus peptidifermentans]SCZ02278.1 Spore coat associated protein JA (CotJA) [Alkaliphilus peptidifermentans DSM 18978]
MYHMDPYYHQHMMAVYHGIYPIPFMPVCVKMAHAYVPYQQYPIAYPTTAEALEKGTYFPELYQPYVPKAKKMGGEE